MITYKKGNIFTTKAQTIVNTINCVGVMGAGIAYEFRLRYKDMFNKYQELCKEKKIDIGLLWIYQIEDKKILNFPTKYDWKYPTKIEYLHKGLQKFIDTYKLRGITSIAFPMLGADRGGLDAASSLAIMEKYLKQCDIEVEIWQFDPMAKDDLYENFKKIFVSTNLETIRAETKIRMDILKKIKNTIEDNHINSLSGLLRVKGIGDKSLEKLFNYLAHRKDNPTLFDNI